AKPSSTQIDRLAAANLCSTSISNVAGEVAGETVGGETVGELARATFVGDGWVRPAGTGFESFSTIGVGAVTTEETVSVGVAGVGAVATEATVSVGAVGIAAVLTGATSLAGGSGSAALVRTSSGPNEMTQSPKMRSPSKTKAPARAIFRIFSSIFAAPYPWDRERGLDRRLAAIPSWLRDDAAFSFAVCAALPLVSEPGSFALLNGARPSRNCWMSSTISMPR